MPNKPFHLFISSSMLVALLLAACSSSKNTTATTETKTAANSSLIQYLRKEPNVRVSGTEENATVFINNIQGVTPTRQGEPLFVVDGNPAAYSYNQAYEMIRGKAIESVKVLKSTVAMVQYGERASNGAVVIRTKTTN